MAVGLSRDRTDTMARTRSLRESLTLALGILTVVALLAMAAVGFTLSAIADTQALLDRSMRSTRNADLSAISLLQELVEDDPEARAALWRDTFVYLDRIRRLTDDPEELQLIADAERAVARYYTTPEGADRRALLVDAFLRIDALVELNFQQATEAMQEAERLGRSTNAVAVGAALSLLGGFSLVVIGLQIAVFHPFLELVAALEQFRSGDLSVRLPVRGPREIQTIAQSFNATALALQEQRESRTAFLAGVAHDLKNPLHALRLSLGLVRPDRPLPDDARLRRILGTMANQLAQLDRMVEDLLEVQRTFRGRPTLQLASYDLRGLAAAALDLYRGTSAKHTFELDAPEPVLAVCDGVRIQQVLNNLIGNAVKYSPDGGRVHVRLRRDGDRARIAVSDEGLGVPETDRERIFHVYQRRSELHRGIPGEGVGLYVSRDIARAHGGDVELESEPGRGSTFTLVLPLAGPPRVD